MKEGNCVLVQVGGARAVTANMWKAEIAHAQ